MMMHPRSRVSCAGAGAGSAAAAAAGADGLYVLKCLVSASGAYVAAAVSGGRALIYSSADLSLVCTYFVDGGADAIRDICWCEPLGAAVYLLVGTEMGALHLVGVPSGAAALRWIVPMPVRRPSAITDDGDYGIYAVAVSPAGDLAAVSVVSALLFFELRGAGAGAPALVGSYTEAHTEAITQLAFHPSLPGYLASAAEDGLLCLFDTSVRGEEDALLTVCNAESAIAHFGFFGCAGEAVWICTRSLTLELWSLAAGERLARLDGFGAAAFDAGLELSELLGCRASQSHTASAQRGAVADDALELFSCASDGALQLWRITPPPSAAGGGGGGGGGGRAQASPQCLLAAVHSAAVRSFDCALVAAAGGDAQQAGSVVFTAGEDGTIVQWVDAGAAALLAGAAAGAVRPSVRWCGVNRAAAAPPPLAASSFASRSARRPVSPPATNGSGSAAAAFLFGAENAGDGSAIDAIEGAAMQAAAASLAAVESGESSGSSELLRGGGAGARRGGAASRGAAAARP